MTSLTGSPGQIVVNYLSGSTQQVGLAHVQSPQPNRSFNWGTVDSFGRVVSDARDVAESSISVVAGETIGSPRAIMLVDGQAFLFDPSEETNLDRLVGVSLNSANLSDMVRVARSGMVTSAGSFTADTVYYAAASGLLTSVLPTSGIIIRIGIAASANSLALEMSEPLILA